MSTTRYAYVFVGSRIELSEVLISEEHIPKGCDYCTTSYESGAKFCSECGKSLVKVRTEKWRPHIKRYLESIGEGDRTPKDFEDFLENVDSIQSSAGGSKHWAIGVNLTTLSDNGYNGDPVSATLLGEVVTHETEIKKRIEAMGLSPRPVELFLYMYISV